MYWFYSLISDREQFDKFLITSCAIPMELKFEND